jgi:hypothetical protein
MVIAQTYCSPPRTLLESIIPSGAFPSLTVPLYASLQAGRRPSKSLVLQSLTLFAIFVLGVWKDSRWPYLDQSRRHVS